MPQVGSLWGLWLGGWAAHLHIRRAPAHGLVALAWLSVRCGGVRVLSSFSPPSSPYSRKQPGASPQ